MFGILQTGDRIIYIYKRTHNMQTLAINDNVSKSHSLQTYIMKIKKSYRKSFSS